MEFDTELTETNKTNALEQKTQNNSEEKQISWSERIKKVIDYFIIEQFLLFYVLPIAVAGLAVNKINIEKACRLNLNYTEEICTKVASGEIDNNDNITKAAQVATFEVLSVMKAWQTPMQSSVPSIVVLFVGAWSDRTGNRKALMLIPMFAEIISSFGLILATYFFLEWPLWVTALIESLPATLSGGTTIALLGSYSYIADVTPNESRTFKMGIIIVVVTLGFPLGTAISGVLTQAVGYYGIFSIAFACYVTGFIHVALRVHDVNRVKTVDTTILKNITDFFHPRNVWETLSVLFLSHKRQRIQIILLICAFIVILGPVTGEGPIMNDYMMVRHNMNLVDVSLFRTYSILMSSIGTAIAVTIFSKYFNMHDSFLGIIATVCKTLANLVYGLAPTKTWFYTGSICDFFGNTGPTAIRSLGSKVVDPENIAKMNSLIGLAEAIIPVGYGPLYALLFSNTVKSYPGTVFLLGAVMTLPAALIFIGLYILFKRQERDVVKQPADKERQAYENDVTSL